MRRGSNQWKLYRNRIASGASRPAATNTVAGPTSVVAESNDVGVSSDWNCVGGVAAIGCFANFFPQPTKGRATAYERGVAASLTLPWRGPWRGRVGARRAK